MHYMFFLILSAFSIAYLTVGIYVFYHDKGANLSRLFLWLCSEASLWACGYAGMIVSESITEANYLRIIAAFGWCFFASTWMEFALSIVYFKGKKLGLLSRVALYIPSFIFFVSTFLEKPDKVIVKLNFGYVEHTPTHVVAYLYAIYYISFVLISLLIIHLWGRRSTLHREKKQARAIVISTLMTFAISVITDTLLPSIGIDLFQMGILAISIAVYGFWKAISRYKMIAITPEYVSDYIFKGVNNPIFFMDDQLHLRAYNDVVLSTLGYDYDELTPDFFEKVIRDNQLDLSILNKEGAVTNRSVEFVKKDGTLLNFILSAAIIHDGFNDRLGIVVILQDVSDQMQANRLLHDYNNILEKEISERTSKLVDANKVLQNEISERIIAEERIKYMGYYDELTALPNRRFFNEYITEKIQKSSSGADEFAIMFLDLDDFKIINDTYGHLSGDNLLMQLAKRLDAVIQPGDILARIGGDEFLISITTDYSENIDLESRVMQLADGIMEALREPVLIKGKENFVTTSIGIAFYPRDGEDVDTLIMNADITMYEAKDTRKNNVKICTPEIKEKMLKKTKFRNDLYRAVEKEEIIVYYQPQVNILTGKIVGVEALLRWHYNHESYIPPTVFIPMAEETGLIVPIGYYMFDCVCKDLKKLQALGITLEHVAVNLSKNQLLEGDFVKEIMVILARNGLKPEFFELEITERITLDSPFLAQVLNELKEFGFKISIDDFGTDYSSFSNLKKLPIDKIKIAMDFIQESTNSTTDAAIVKSIIQLAYDLNLSIIAEGVETEAQMAFVKEKRCYEVQGYYFYKPMPFKNLETCLLTEEKN